MVRNYAIHFVNGASVAKIQNANGHCRLHLAFKLNQAFLHLTQDISTKNISL